MAGTVWYQVIVPADGQLRADPSGSSFADVCVTGFRDVGGGLSGLQLICCAAIGTLTTPVTAGEVIYLQVGRVE